MELSSFDNQWYDSGASKFILLIWYFVNVLFFRNPLNPISSIKIYLLRLFGAKLGNSITIKPAVNIKYPWRLEIGDNTWIGENVWIDNLADVRISANVCISQGAMLLTGNHNYKKSSFDLMVGAITLEEGVWIGAKSIVCPGVTCKSHAILSVRSIAIKDLDPYTIYSGNPCQPIRERVIQS